MAVPEPADRLGREDSRRSISDASRRQCPDQRLDPDQFGAQDFAASARAENRPIPPVFVACSLPQNSMTISSTLVIPGRCAAANPESRDSRSGCSRIAPE